MLHSALSGGDSDWGKEQPVTGSPYSLVLLGQDERKAFSYGFGEQGASGRVLFTGLLDGILTIPPPSPLEGGFFSSIFGTPAPSQVSRPTEAQTLHLACVLAHEMGHLLLSHHLETLSQQRVLWPSILGLAVDVVRAFTWPST